MPQQLAANTIKAPAGKPEIAAGLPTNQKGAKNEAIPVCYHARPVSVAGAGWREGGLMATVTLTLTDDEGKISIKFVSEPGLPKCGDQTAAQTLGLLLLEDIEKHMRGATDHES